MGWKHVATFRFFWETAGMGDNKIVRIGDCFDLANRVSRF